MRLRFAFCLLVFFASMLTLSAQEEFEATPDSTYSEEDFTDTTYIEPDTTYDDDYTPGYDTTYDDGYGTDYGEYEVPPTPALLPGGGVYFGPTFELTALAPSTLDPDLDGDMVLFGLQGYAIIDGWLLGATGVEATLYDISPKYDEFAFSYAGFLTGYDLKILDAVSLRLGTMIGAGDLKMIKKRPDLALSDSTGKEILERYRDESFFMLRPGGSIGFTPLPFLNIRFAVDYLYPIGGKNIGDLKALTYGLHLMAGFGR